MYTFILGLIILILLGALVVFGFIWIEQDKPKKPVQDAELKLRIERTESEVRKTKRNIRRIYELLDPEGKHLYHEK